MSRKRPVLRDVAADFRLNELFFSRTDLKGIIQSGNAVFTRVSGYEETELLGFPHSIIRHPDTPKAIFALFWEYLKAQRLVCAYVKNLAKDGSYYWVFAGAFPIDGGYLSIRLKPSSNDLTVIQTLYKELCAIEATQNLEVARGELVHALAKLGFESYDHFMTHALVTEIQSRRDTLAAENRLSGVATPSEVLVRQGASTTMNQLRHASLGLSQDAARLFECLQHIVERSELLAASSAQILKLFLRLKPLALNMIVAAEKLGESSRTLNTVAENFQSFATNIKTEVEGLEAALKRLANAVRDAKLKCGSSQLQAEMMSLFTNELSDDQDERGYTAFVTNYRCLFELVRRYVAEVTDSLHHVANTVAAFEQRSSALGSVLAGLEVIRIRGTIEAAYLPEGVDFVAHIHSMQEFVNAVRTALVTLLEKSRGSRSMAAQGQEVLTGMFTRLQHLEKNLADPHAASH